MVEYDYIMLCEECKKCKHVDTCLDTRYGKIKDKCNYFEKIIMRDATPEERESVNKYIRGVNNMRIVIDIPEEIIKLCKEDKVSTVKLSAEYFRNGTPIPDNATNGDVMEIIFPKIGVYDEWYDEPYQKGDK